MAKNEFDSIKKELEKSIGVIDLQKNGNSVTLSIDPQKLKPKERKQLLAGVASVRPDLKKTMAGWDKWGNDHDKAVAYTANNAPFEAPYFEGIYSSFSTMNAHDKMRLAMRYFRTEPLVGKTIELMKTYSNDGFRNEHKDPKIKQFYDNWCDAVNMDQVLGWIFLEYYRTGNVTTWRELVQYKKGMFKSNIMPYSSSESAKKNNWTNKLIPGAYTVLNPLTVYVSRVNGYNDSLYYSQPQIDNALREGTSFEDPTRLLLRQLPHEMLDAAEKTKDFSNVPLADKNVRRIMRMRQPYEAYGNILMERAFAPIHEKNKMREMDLQMVNSLINQIITVTVGNDDYPATPKQLKNLQEAFRNVGKSQILFWNHTLRVEVIRPDTKVLNKEKYARIDEDIRNAFGVSEVLTGGGNAKVNFAIAYLSLKAFLANLIEGRKDVIRWLKKEYEDIANVMGFDSYPEPVFNPLSLTDEVAEKQLIMQMVDRNIVSIESAQTRLGYDPSVELERMRKEQPLKQSGLIGIPQAGSPYQQSVQDKKDGLAGSDKDVNSKDDVGQEIKTQDSKKPETKETEELIRERKEGNTVPDPSKPLPTANKPKKNGADGRPKTPQGNYPSQRKIAKIKGQGSELDIDISNMTHEEVQQLTEVLGFDIEKEKELMSTSAYMQEIFDNPEEEKQFVLNKVKSIVGK